MGAFIARIPHFAPSLAVCAVAVLAASAASANVRTDAAVSVYPGSTAEYPYYVTWSAPQDSVSDPQSDLMTSESSASNTITGVRVAQYDPSIPPYPFEVTGQARSSASLATGVLRASANAGPGFQPWAEANPFGVRASAAALIDNALITYFIPPSLRSQEVWGRFTMDVSLTSLPDAYYGIASLQANTYTDIVRDVFAVGPGLGLGERLVVDIT